MIMSRSLQLVFVAMVFFIILHACRKSDEPQQEEKEDLAQTTCSTELSDFLFEAGSTWVYRDDSTGEKIEVRASGIEVGQTDQSSTGRQTCFFFCSMSPTQFSYVAYRNELYYQQSNTLPQGNPAYRKRPSKELQDSTSHFEAKPQALVLSRHQKMHIGSFTFLAVEEVVSQQIENGISFELREFFAPHVGRIRSVKTYSDGTISSLSLVNYHAAPKVDF